jgi:diguanylate cyclase
MPAVPALLPHDEAARQAALDELGLLDTVPEALYDDIVLLAAQICGTPIGLISLVDSQRQWFKASVGLSARETSRDAAFCAHAIVAESAVFVVEDAALDLRFRDNPLVTGEPRIRFYAGAPVVSPSGHALGTVCVIDTVPRVLSAAQLCALMALSRQVVALFELHSRTRSLERQASEARRAEAAAADERLQSHRAIERARDLLQRTGALARIGGWELDLATARVHWTEEVYRIHELDPSTELDPAAAISFYAPEARPLIQNAIEIALADGTPWDLQLPFVTAKGRCLMVRAQGEVVLEGGKVVRLFGTFQDVTDRHRAERKAFDSQRRLQLLTDHLPAMVAHVDNDQRYRFLNAHIQRTEGTVVSTAIGRTMREVRGEATYALLAPQIQKVLRGEKVAFTYSAEGANGINRHYQSHYVPDLDAEGRVDGFYAMTIDITALHETQAQLEALARIDTLTALPNRRQFDERIVEALARARRSKQTIALMFLDIDHFKHINDSHGHAVGDAVLREFARRLKANLRVTDTVARLGGDEFVVLLENAGCASDFGVLAAKIVAGIRPRFELGEIGLAVTTSVGVASCATGELGPAELLASADAALYRAKSLGRDRFEIG